MRGSHLIALPTVAPVLLVLLTLGASGCGPAEAPPPATAAATKPAAEAKKPVIVEDRTPVEAPAGLVVQAHSAGLKALVRSVKTWIPGSVELDPRALVSEVASSTLERIVDIDKPVDFAVLAAKDGDRDPSFAVAFGVEDGLDVAAAIKDNYRTEPLPGGVLRLVPNSGSKSHCVVAPALGAAKHRLVCTRRGDDPMPLAPWLARGVTRKDEPQSVARLEVDIAALKKTYKSEIEKGRVVVRSEIASEVKTGYAELDRAIKPIAKSLADEFFDAVDDLEALTIDGTAPAEGAQLALTMAFSGTKSWTARAMLAGGDAPSPANPRFAKLPGDGSWLGMFQRGLPQHDALIAPIQTAVRDLITALAVDFKWPAKDRDLALEVVKLAFPASADTAFVSGNAGKVEWPEKAPRPHGDVERFGAGALLSKSWSVSVVERDAKGPIALAKAFFAWAQRPSFAATYRALTKDRLGIKVTAKPLAIKDLPKGAFAQRGEIELLLPPKADDAPAGKGKPAPKGKDTPLLKLVTETIVAPEGNTRTWVAYSQNMGDGEAWKRLSGAMSGVAGGSLGSRPGFDFVVAGTPTAGGLIALDGLFHTFTRTRKSDDMLSKLPDQGRGAFQWRITPSKPPKSTSELTLLVPRDAIAAVYQLMMR